MDDILLEELKEKDPEFTQQLKAATQGRRTPRERFEQRVSFVYGNQPKELNFTREQIEKRLKQMD